MRWLARAAQGEPQLFEWLARAKSGRVFWVEVNLKRAVIGGKDRLLAIVRDIAERKRAEEALRKAHAELEVRVEQRTAELARANAELARTNAELARTNAELRIRIDERERLATQMRLLLQSTDEGIFGLDLDGRCTFVNRAGAEMLRYQPEELLGKRVHETIHHSRPDGSPYPRQECPLFRALQTGQGARIASEVLWRSDGTPFPVEYAAHPIVDPSAGATTDPGADPIAEGGAIQGAVVTFVDITERIRAQAEREHLLAEIQHRAAQLDATITSIADGLLIYSSTGEIVRMNAAAEHFLGFGPAERKLPLAERMALLRAEAAEGKPFPVQEHPVYRALHGEK